MSLPSRPIFTYNYKDSLVFQDDFATGINSSGNIGELGWLSAGTITNPSSEVNHPGIVLVSTGAGASTLARITFNASLVIDSSLATFLEFIIRLNTNDINTSIRVGARDTVSSFDPANGIYFEKLDNDVNWFSVTRSASTETRVNTNIAVTTEFVKLSYIRVVTGEDHPLRQGVTFKINDVNVGNAHTTNLPLVLVSPAVSIINSIASAKTVSVDYFQMYQTGIIR